MMKSVQGIVKLDDIIIGERYRDDLGDIEELAEDIKDNGLLHNLVVNRVEEGDDKVKLVCGGRRLAALYMLEWKEAPCNIYLGELSELDLRTLELTENLRRKQMTWQEEIELKGEIHRLMQEEHGVPNRSSEEGWSMEKTAELVGSSQSAVQRDLSLNDTVKEMPELFADCKSKAEADKVLKKIKEEVVRSVLAEKLAEEEAVGGDSPFSSDLADAYVTGDFLNVAKQMESGVFNLIELDPPYAIDLKKVKGGSETSVTLKRYQEIDSEEYEQWMLSMLAECHRLLGNGGWMLVWFGWSWLNQVYRWLEVSGFECMPIPAIWSKKSGQTKRPDIYLARSAEPFIYARKGNAVIKRQGRADVFSYTGVAESKKIHPTERPIELMIDVLSTFCEPGARVCVPCLGSGVTLKAAQQLGMVGWGTDIVPEFRDNFMSTLL